MEGLSGDGGWVGDERWKEMRVAGSEDRWGWRMDRDGGWIGMEMVQGCPVQAVGTSWIRGCCAHFGEPPGYAGFPAWMCTSGEAAEPPGDHRLGVVDDPSCEDATTKVTAQGHEAFLAAASGFGCCSQGALKVTLAGDPPV